MTSLFGFQGSTAGQLAYDMLVLEEIEKEEEVYTPFKKDKKKKKRYKEYTMTELGLEDDEEDGETEY